MLSCQPCNSLYTRFVRLGKVEQSLYRFGQACRLQEVEASRFQDNRHMKVVRLSTLRTGHLYPQKIFLVLILVRSWVDPQAIVPEGLYQWKIQMGASEIEPTTFRLVAQCLNQLRHTKRNTFLGLFIKSGEVTVSLIISARSQATTRLPLDRFSLHLVPKVISALHVRFLRAFA
jgi:hypothetical protein